MRFISFVLLMGCVDVSYVDEDEKAKCDHGYDFVWTELDGGTCGSFGKLIDDMTECAVTVASECIESNEIECKNGEHWNWRRRNSDDNLTLVNGPDCKSRYELERR